MLCSDGLYTMVREEEMVSVLAYDAPPQLKAEILINMANDNGGKDNIAVTLVQIK
jgi:PPM family protein phosphatase